MAATIIKLKKCFIFLSSLIFISTGSKSENLYAYTNGFSVISLGVTSGGAGFFDLAEAPGAASPRNCLYGLYYINLDTPGGKALYSSLIIVKISGKKIFRLDWQKKADGSCSADTIMLLDK